MSVIPIKFNTCHKDAIGRKRIDWSWHKIIKSELIHETWKLLNKEFRKKDVEVIINAFINAIKCEIKNDNKVKIDGFGTFSSHARQSYVGKSTNGNIEKIPDTKYIIFKPSKKLKE